MDVKSKQRQRNYLRIEASLLIVETLPFHIQIRNCNNQLTPMLSFNPVTHRTQAAHDLRDEIFACHIMIETLHRRAFKLREQANAIE